MRATLTASVVVAALAAVVIAGGAATAQDGGEDAPTATGASDEALLDRLVELERELPPLPPSDPQDVVLDDETTWGELQGDFFSALANMELLSDQARQLFIEADDADGETAEAVSAIARSYLQIEQGYRYLADYESHDLARPVGETDADGVATGADEAVGLAETGVALLTEARSRALLGYAVLRDSAVADDTEKSLFDVAYRDAETFLDETRPRLHELLSLPTVGVLVPIERFDPVVGQARAKHVETICIDRSRYYGEELAARTDGQAVDQISALVQLLDEGLEVSDAVDCPDVPEENDVTTAGS